VFADGFIAGPKAKPRNRVDRKIPCFSLLWRKNSLFDAQKFPVPLRREFRRNGPVLRDNSAPKMQKTAEIRNIPCKIPC